MDITYFDPSELEPFIKNPKKHPQRQIDMIKKSIETFGFYQPIIAIKEGNMIVCGHARREAAMQLGIAKVPVIVLDMSYEKAVACVIADNRLAALGVDDIPLLKENFSTVLTIPDFDITAIGYDLDEVNALMTIDDSFSFTSEEEEEEDPEDMQDVEGDQCGKSYAVHISFSDKDRAESFLQQIGAAQEHFGKGKTSTIVKGDDLILDIETLEEEAD